MGRQSRTGIWTAVLAAIVLCGPAGAQPEPPVVPTQSRIDAVFGRAVVFRVRPTADRPPETVTVKLDDGRTVDGHVQWVGVSAGSAQECAGGSWLPTPPSFEVVRPDEPGAGMGPGSWMMRLSFPLSASGQGFWLGGVRYEPNWLPDPRRLVNAGVVGRAWSSPLVEDERADPMLVRLIESYHEHPLYAWRYDLAMDRFTPGEEFDQPEDGGPIEDLAALRAEIDQPEPFDPITRDLADIERARWQVALARLWNADPTLSLPVRDRLAGVIESPWGFLPAWTVDQAQIDDLLDALLDTRSSDERIARHVRSWLEESEKAIGWVIDDAGRQDAITGEFLPTIGVVNTTETTVLAWARAPDLSSPSDLTPLMPSQVQMLRGEIQAMDFARPDRGAGVEVRVGDWDGYLPALGLAIPASPPGFALGPLRARWTLDAWRSMDDARAAEVPRDRSAAVLLFKGPATAIASAVGPAPRAAGGQEWTLYIEARTAGGSADDSVELWFGPYGQPLRVLRVFADGRLVDGLTGKDPPGISAQVVRLADRWVGRLALPPGVVEEGQMVRIGVVRRDGCGLVSSWPRRMLPGQAEPGRVAVRLDAWDGYDNR